MSVRCLPPWIWLLAAGAAWPGCETIDGVLPVAAAMRAPPATLRAGAAKVDITPMPGFPMGGFGPSARFARGVWTRLYARAVYLENADGRSLVFVVCDLWSMPGGLADRVADLVATEHGLRHIGREQILIAATHTHTSPAAFSSDMAHNVLAANEHGFDRRLFRWLAARIAGAIAEACARAADAELCFGGTDLGGLYRNRSYDAFRRNGADADLVVQEYVAKGLTVAPTPFPVPCEDAYRAFDPRLRLVCARGRSNQQVIGVLAFTGVHPTVMGQRTEVYSSDIFGVATARAEEVLARGSGARRPVVALFNSAEGDVVANWATQDRRSALHIGERIGDAILATVGGRCRPLEPSLALAFDAIQFRPVAPPLLGAAAIGGPEGDWTVFHDVGSWEGQQNPEQTTPGQRPKLNVVAPYFRGGEDACGARSLWWVVRSSLSLADSARVGVYRLGDVVLATLPGEFTTVMARQIESSLHQACPDARDVVLVGLANEYVSYFTTAAEFDVQDYEGAATVFGRDAGEVVRAKLASLAGQLETWPPRAAPIAYHYTPSVLFLLSRSFGADTFEFPGTVADRLHGSYDALANILVTERAGIPMPNHPHFSWLDCNPSFDREGARITPRVAIEVCQRGAWHPLICDGLPETDERAQFVTILALAHADRSRWLTYWLRPLSEGAERFAGQRFRFRVDGGRGTFYSDGFAVDEIVNGLRELPFCWDPLQPSAG